MTRIIDIRSIDNSIRDKLIQFNNIISKVNFDDISQEDIQIFDELAKFCSSNQISSSSLEQMLQTDYILKSTCENLRRLYALYGFHLEMRTARICAADKNQNIDECFKDRQSYKKFAQYEIDILAQLGVRLANNSTTNDDNTSLLVTKIAFIGSGPMPNSSMIILNDHAPYVDIYNIDISQEANQLASIISEQILPPHLSKRMHFITQDITEKPLPIQVKSILDECQLIYLASFVGVNELEKLDILKNIVNQSNDELNKKNIQYFMIRTAEGLYEVLFPKVNAEKIATLRANTSDVRQDTDTKFLFQIKTIYYSRGNYGFGNIIASHAN